MNSLTPEFNITIHAGADYKLNLQFQSDDDEVVYDYGALVFDETLYDSTGLTVDEESEELITTDEWSASSEILVYEGSGNNPYAQMELCAQIREFPEAYDYYDFGISLNNTDGFVLTLDHDTTASIPWALGYYDVFLTNTSDSSRAKILKGKVTVIRGTTR